MRHTLHRAILVGFLSVASSAFAQETTLYATDFTDLSGWTVTTGCQNGTQYRWAADATPANAPAGPYRSPPASLNFNDGVDLGGGHVGWHTCGWVRSDPIDLSAAVGVPRLRFWAAWDSEVDCGWDILSLKILDAATGQTRLVENCLNAHDPAAGGSHSWRLVDIELDRSWGAVEIEFGFDAVDVWFNEGAGVFIDDLEVVDVLPVYSTVCVGYGSTGYALGSGCPCRRASASGGCRNSTGLGARLVASGSTSVAVGDLVLVGSQLRPNQFGTYLQGDSSLNSGNGVGFGAGLRCAGGALVRLQQVHSDGAGASSTSVDIALRGGVSPGDTRTYQLWYRDPTASPCNAPFNFTNGVEVTWMP